MLVPFSVAVTVQILHSFCSYRGIY